MYRDESDIHIILLSGGSGTRLWPLSNNYRSKQFLKVLRDQDGNGISMVQRTFGQIKRVVPGADITVATCKTQEQLLRTQVGDDCKIVIEPERRDTAPAIMLACEHLRCKQGVSEDATVVVMPIDSYVGDDYFSKIFDVANAVSDGFADIVLLGTQPSYPSEKYGYIVPEKAAASLSRVESFREKPNCDTARRLISEGALWNNCVFGFRLGYMLDVLRGYGTYSSYEDLVSRYGELPNNSIDYEIVEKSNSVAVVSYSGYWKDLGTWNTLSEEMSDGCSGFAVFDRETCPNTHVINELDTPLIVSGIENAVVISTADGILVCGKEQSGKLKELVNQLEDLQ